MNRTELYKLFDLNIDPGAPTFILYSPKQSNRLTYVSKFIFEQVLKVKINITHNSSEFENSTSLKINYSEKKMEGVFQILPAGLLFETGISQSKPKFTVKNDLIYFFENELGYDFFSSVFYFISRYEEWQDFEADVHGRFEAKASLLFKNNKHLKPVVDHWIVELKKSLEGFYKGVVFPKTKFKVISTIDVDNLYAYKEKGVLRTGGAFLKDLLKFDLKNIKRRKNVLLKKEEDPFDIYTPVSDFCSQKKIPLIYFFLFRTGTKYDRTVDPSSNAFADVFKRIKKAQAAIGLHPSYYSSLNKDLLEKEVEKFSQRLGEKVQISRQHYLKFDIKTTPGMLLKNNIIADFTMGFASNIGFRAGTSFPFYYYDLAAEKQKDLLFVPFCAMDGAYFVYDKLNPDNMLRSLTDLATEVKKVNGYFISVFHERTFSNHLYPGYDRIYKNFHQTIIDQ